MDASDEEREGSVLKNITPHRYVCPKDLHDSTECATGVVKPSQEDDVEESEVDRVVGFSRDGTPRSQASSLLSSAPSSPSRSLDDLQEDAMNESSGPMKDVQKGFPEDVESEEAQDGEQGVSMEGLEKGFLSDADEEDDRGNPTGEKSMNVSSGSKQGVEEGCPADPEADETRQDDGDDAMRTESMQDRSNDEMDVDEPDAGNSAQLGAPFELRWGSVPRWQWSPDKSCSVTCPLQPTLSTLI
jgi:hypothetical protein